MNMSCYIGCALLSMPVLVAGEAWTEDFTVAQKKAAERNVPVLAVFTGSDWCVPCQTLKRKVLDTPEFEEYAKNRFVLVEIDFPKTKAQADALKKRNAELSARYCVTGFPTLLVLTSSGSLLGGFVGGFDRFEEVKKPLDEASAVQVSYENAMKKAMDSQGEEKLAALIEAYKSVPANFRRYNQSLADEIMALDQNDVSGLIAERTHREKLVQERMACDEELRPAAQQGPVAFLASLDALLQKDYAEETRSNLLNMKFNTQIATATDAQAFGQALNTMDLMAEANPGEKERLQSFRKRLEERSERILEANRKRVESLKAVQKDAPQEANKP